MSGHLENCSPGAFAILEERRRQVEVLGYFSEQDDLYRNGELALAGMCYAFFAAQPVHQRAAMAGRPWWRWPWGNHTWKPKTRRKDLVRAGALIAAEIDRLDRLGEGGHE